MPDPSPAAPPFETLTDVSRIVQAAEGYEMVRAALLGRCSATVDGAWGSSAALVTATLAREVPHTLLVVIAHPHDTDGWTDDLASFGGTPPQYFPAWEHLPDDTTLIDEVAGQRLCALKALEGITPPRCILTTIQALIQPVPSRDQLRKNRRLLNSGDTIDLQDLCGWLLEHGYRRTDAVEMPGEFSRRGGILDVFSIDAESPFRIELFGDEIDSIRLFSPTTQRSLGTQPQAELTSLPRAKADTETRRNKDTETDRGHFCDYLPPGSWVVLVEPEDLQEASQHYLERVADPAGLFSVTGVFQQVLRFPSITVSALPHPSVEATCHLRVESVERFSGNVAQVREELDTAAGTDWVLIACHNEAESKRLGEILAAGQLALSDRLRLVTGKVRAGFRMVEAGLVVLGSQDLFHRDETRQIQPRRRLESRAIDSFLDLAEGDLVVHVSHGIARYHGMQLLDKHGHAEEHLVLEFASGVRLYVPAAKIDLVQKYVGGSRTQPELSHLGGTAWEKRKARVAQAVLDLAAEMIDLQALREAQPGIVFPADSEWQAEFEASFPYQETPDQLTTLSEIKGDMQRGRPMDRLICGDVGYGKTELAVRAAFKAVDNGRQVAVLVPTTVLAEQHYRTFSQRLAEYPFVVECLSRFRSTREQKRILERLTQGGIDVVVGTHRLLSADV
jgi:transcription-repair coupling factor (superfamily II helicase)